MQNPQTNVLIPESSLSYLYLEILRIDLLIRRAIECWQQAGQDITEKFRGLYINEEDIYNLLSLPIGGNWDSKTQLPNELEEEFRQSKRLLDEQLEIISREATQTGQLIRLKQLQSSLGLSSFEYDALLICLAPAIDSRYEKIFGFLHDDVTQKYASARLIFDLLLPAGLERVRFLEYFQNGPLAKYKLIQPVINHNNTVQSPLQQAYLPSAEIITWLAGEYRAPSGYENCFQMFPSESSTSERDLYIEPELDMDIIRKTKPIIILYGQDDLQQKETARFITNSLQQPRLSIRLAKVDPQNIADGSLASYALRDAKLNHAIPCFTHWETLQSETDLQKSFFPELNKFEDIVILQSTNFWQINRNGNGYIKPVLWVKCDLPSSSHRLQLWRRCLHFENRLSSQDLEILSGQFNLTSNQIRNAVFSARDTALQENRTIVIADLYAAARQHSSHHLESLAVKIPHRFGWEDIVLPEEELNTLHEIAETVRWRSVVLEEWGVGEKLMPNAGVSALFAGPSGTGKTLAAQVIAAELKMDLYKIDLSTVVSKYIGETEKNLERIFTQARNSNSILFFDEADAIFGKRSEVKDAHDRYANIEVGYLLQRMETYDGIVILATNLRSNLDDAFTRRLQFVVDFPFPDEEERLKIWNVLFPPGVPREPGIDFSSFAHRFKLTGGNIRNIIIGAAFLAASQRTPVTTQHILHSLRREMQNMGRLINEKDVSTLSKEDDHGK